MLRRVIATVVLGMFLLCSSGCNLIGLALSAAAAYGMSKVLDN